MMDAETEHYTDVLKDMRSAAYNGSPSEAAITIHNLGIDIDANYKIRNGKGEIEIIVAGETIGYVNGVTRKEKDRIAKVGKVLTDLIKSESVLDTTLQ